MCTYEAAFLYNRATTEAGSAGAGYTKLTPDRHLGLSKERLMPHSNAYCVSVVPVKISGLGTFQYREVH